jgi:hypothetical protein
VLPRRYVIGQVYSILRTEEEKLPHRVSEYHQPLGVA